MELLSPYYGGYLDMREMSYAFYMVVAGFLPAITLCYAILVAMAVWSYLYTPRSAGFFHSLPLHRRTLFCTNLLSGLAMLLIPYAVVGALLCVILLCFGILPVMAVLQTIAAVVGHTLFYFGTATFVAMITSSFITLPVFYFLFHFFAVIMEALLGWFAEIFIFGCSGSTWPSLTVLSPTVAFYQHISVERVQEAGGLLGVELNGLWIIWGYALVGIALTGCAYLLYRLRHSESAGQVVAYRPLKPVFRYGVALCTAMTFGPVLYEGLWGSTFQRTLYSELVPMVVCLILVGLVGYYIASMLLAKTPRVFKGSAKGAAVTAALVLVICCGAYFDVFGLGRRIPDPAKVEQVTVYSGSQEATAYGGEVQVERIIDLQKMILDSEKEIRSYRWGYDDGFGTSYIRFSYELENGKRVVQNYSVPMARDRWNRDEGYEGRLKEIFNDPQTALRRIEPPDGAMLSAIYMECYYDTVNLGTDLAGESMERVYEALHEDISAGHFPQYIPYWSEADTETVFGYLSLEYRRPYVDDSGIATASYSRSTIDLTSRMTATIEALLEVGALSQEQYNKMLNITGLA